MGHQGPVNNYFEETLHAFNLPKWHMFMLMNLSEVETT